ncbi:MAG: amidohydrolase [Cyclobacteriaceae bacterium]|jgi:amidohydrolase
MNELIDLIKLLAEQQHEEIVAIRRHIHANPELSFQEYNTASFVEDKLRSFGLKTVQRISNTGVVALIEGHSEGPTIALRADLDALPIVEGNHDLDYRSTKDGVMHACGHDVHSSCLLGAAKILQELSPRFAGTIKLIFQPGEEKAPGGASILIKDGVLENPKPASIIGQHVMPLIPVGKVGFRSGKYMASADEIYLTVKGKGGHAAMPDKLIDPILVSAQILINLQQVISRKADPKIPSVLSFGDIHGYGATNVIPDEVKIAGTFRTFDEEWRAKAHHAIENIATHTAKAFGAACEVTIVKGYPFLVNDPEVTAAKVSAAKAYLGEENVVELDLWMASEDFAFYSQTTPASFYRLGTRNEEKGITAGVHTANFNIDESAMKIGVGLMSWLAIEALIKDTK